MLKNLFYYTDALVVSVELFLHFEGTKLVSCEFLKAAEILRSDLLKPRVRDSKKQIFPFVLTFNPNLPSINELIRKHFYLLETSPKL